MLPAALLLSAVVASHTCTTLTQMSICGVVVVLLENPKSDVFN